MGVSISYGTIDSEADAASQCSRISDRSAITSASGYVGKSTRLATSFFMLCLLALVHFQSSLLLPAGKKMLGHRRASMQKTNLVAILYKQELALLLRRSFRQDLTGPRGEENMRCKRLNFLSFTGPTHAKCHVFTIN